MLRELQIEEKLYYKSTLYIYLLYIYISKQGTDRQINGQLMMIYSDLWLFS